MSKEISSFYNVVLCYCRSFWNAVKFQAIIKKKFAEITARREEKKTRNKK